MFYIKHNYVLAPAAPSAPEAGMGGSTPSAPEAGMIGMQCFVQLDLFIFMQEIFIFTLYRVKILKQIIMDISYTRKNLVNVNTKDGYTLRLYRHLLSLRFNLFASYFDKFPNSKDITIKVTKADMEFTFYLLDTISIPTTDKDWLRFLITLDYLDIVDTYIGFYLFFVRSYIHEHKKYLFLQTTTLRQYITYFLGICN